MTQLFEVKVHRKGEGDKRDQAAVCGLPTTAGYSQ